MKMLRRIRIYLVFYENEYNCSEICILLRMQRIRKGIFMLQMLYPDEYLDSTYTIDFKKLYKDGYRVTIEAMSTVGISSGSLILRNSAKLLAPSMRAASTISPGRFMTAP